MLPFEDQLFLIESRGLPAEAVHWLARTGHDEAHPGAWAEELTSPRHRQRALLAAQSLGLMRNAPVTWADRASVAALAARLTQSGVSLTWRGDPAYPVRLSQRLAGEAPPWVWIAGPEARCTQPACAIIGSRQSPPPLLAAARRLARALAEAGIVTVSGMAPGADTAAHEGALLGAAGTLAIPARGILQIDLTATRAARPGAPPRMTVLALDRPEAPFSAALAIRRNDVIAAMGEGLILVASGPTGGSFYALNWALRHGLPVWCFEAGAATPPANRHLLRRGQARPLDVKSPPDRWVASVSEGLKAFMHATPSPPPAPAQMDWLKNSA